jgi:hypothetical protein
VENISAVTIIANMIYKRNRKGLFYHDLVWAYFKIHEVDTLRIFAQGLLSGVPSDFRLCCDLLNINTYIPCIGESYDKEKIYESYMYWLNDNSTSITFTDESYQLTGKPVIYNTKIAQET